MISNKKISIIGLGYVGLPLATEFAKKYNLFLIEDCCDALGAEFKGKKVGTFGDIATLSFYPAHHITMGEGGGIFCKSSTVFMSFGFIASRFSLKPKVFILAVSISLGKKVFIYDNLVSWERISSLLKKSPFNSTNVFSAYMIFHLYRIYVYHLINQGKIPLHLDFL